MGANTSFVDYYELLGIATDADADQIRRAFITLAKQHHPDKGGDTRDMQLYSNAYRTLSSLAKRRAYDMQHNFYSNKAEMHYATDISSGYSGSGDELSDDEIDSFLDSLYAEYSAQSRIANKSHLARFRQWLFDEPQSKQ